MENRSSIRRSHSNNSGININVKMSEDAESQEGQVESFYSPLRSDSPFCSDDPFPPTDTKSPGKAMVAVDKFYSPLSTPTYQNSALSNLNFQANLAPPPRLWKEKKGKDKNKDKDRSSSMVVFNTSVKEDVASGMAKVGSFGGGEDREDGQRRPEEADSLTMRRSVRASLGFRLCEVILCLISFSVMVSDRTQGWSGDSFDRYREYRYIVAVTIIGLAHSLFQAYDLTYYQVTGKHVISHHFRYHFEFSMDQILAYLLISASSSSAFRIDDWTSNWGKDEFTEMASASVAMSFLAFIAFALSSLISGYNLCNRNYT